MATFNEAISYLIKELNWEPNGDGAVGELNISDGRTQLVYATRKDHDGDALDFLIFYSPFAKVGTVNIVEILKATRNSIAGISENPAETMYCAKVAIPIADLDASELSAAALAVAIQGDVLEKLTSGSDTL